MSLFKNGLALSAVWPEVGPIDKGDKLHSSPSGEAVIPKAPQALHCLRAKFFCSWSTDKTSEVLVLRGHIPACKVDRFVMLKCCRPFFLLRFK